MISTGKTSFGDRMKFYERQIVGHQTTPLQPVMARLDGKAFHSLCRKFDKPFDGDFHALMVSTGLALLEYSNALICYVQSDEISLAWYTGDFKSQIFMGGKVQKMVSILAGVASVHFNRCLYESDLSKFKNKLGIFDCRVWQVPNKTEGANVFLWREQDATRNSVLGLGQAHFSHKQLHGKCQSDIHEMLHLEGVNWADLEPWKKRGTWLQKRKVVRRYTCDELSKLPAMHHARSNPELEVERWSILELDMPPFGRVTNRSGVVFDGEDPVEGVAL